MAANKRPNLFALLIGIDRYSQVRLPDNSYYPHLRGCINDINLIEQMLRSHLNLPDERVIRLISGNSSNCRKNDRLPTYENLVKAFQEVTDQARTGDQVYIHYSGHGGRSATMFEELKGKNGLDESLVPCDIGENGAYYLRDLEIAYLLKKMADKGLVVTMVLDCCHSGGATRGKGGAAVRGISSIDTTPPPEESPVAAKKTLIETFRQLPRSATRNINAASAWRLPTPKNFVLIAACRANELANEYPFDGRNQNGALTYWMLDALKQIGEGFTYKMLYNRIVAKVHTKFVNQTPQIEGDRDRQIFGDIQYRSIVGVNVLKVDLPNNRIQLNTGSAQGVGKGAQFAVYAANATEIAEPARRLAVVQLEDAGTTETWARIIDGSDRTGEITEGAQAVLLGIGRWLRGRIRLVLQDGAFDEALQAAAIEKLRAAIMQDETDAAGDEKWIRPATEDEEADFQVAVNIYGEYEIWDASGRKLPNLRPALSISKTDAALQTAQRLVHLTRYRNVRLIENTDLTSPLAGKIIAELGKVHTDESGINVFQPFGVNARSLTAGEEVWLRITNLSKIPVNITVMDLQPDWGISRLYPPPEWGMDYELLESGQDIPISITTSLPEDYQDGTDTLKVFAVVDGASYDGLIMDSLDKPPSEPKSTRFALDELGQFLQAFASPRLKRHAIVSAPKGGSWTTTSIELHIRRPGIAHFPDPALSLLQSAFDKVIADQQQAVGTRGFNDAEQVIKRPNLSNPIINEIAQYCMATAQNHLTEAELTSVDSVALDEAQERGVVDAVKYCASMAVGAAREWFNAKIRGDDLKYNQYQAALTQKFGDCDPNYIAALEQFIEFLRHSGHVPYRTPVRPSDYTIEGERLPSNAVVGLVADWATGEPEALEVLRQIKGHNPHVAVHLGDIYYAGTEHEVENYFYRPWKHILEPEASGVLSLALPGNHDLYAGGKPFYDLLDKLAALNKLSDKTASYFCLRNRHWQIIGLDTALHARLHTGPTFLETSELEWLEDKIKNSDGRRTILLSHHQLFSSNEQFAGKSYNEKLYRQLAPILPQIDLWLWGHEHDLVIFGEYMNLKRGRCIGGSAFPVGNFQMPATRFNPDVPYNEQVALSKGRAFYHHCYTILKLDGARATVFYYEDLDGGKLLFQEAL
jgi:hypothetical protein